MNNIIKKVKAIAEKLVRKGFWIEMGQAQKIEQEAVKNWNNNESALMRHIIRQWFQK